MIYRLLTTSFCMLEYDSSFFVFSRYWPFGQDGCSLHAFQGMIAVLASISFMATIAWDRYHQYCTSEYSEVQLTVQKCGNTPKYILFEVSLKKKKKSFCMHVFNL